MRTYCAILSILFVLPVLADAPAPQPAPADVELSVGQNNELTLLARQDQTVCIRLAGNATTGFSWVLVSQLDEKGVACDILSPVGEMGYQSYPAEGKVGVGGESLATFKATKPGLAKLNFAYRRPWEKDKEPDRTFSVCVNVLPVEKDKPQ